MTWRDKMEIGLTDDAPFRRDNLPDHQMGGGERPTGPGRSPEVVEARRDAVKKARVQRRARQHQQPRSGRGHRH